MNSWLDHLVVAPIVAPLAAAGVMLMVQDRHRNFKAALGFVTIIALLAISLYLLFTGAQGDGAARIYTLGNWPAPFGIVLVADYLSALMLTLTAILALAALVFSLARWDRAGPRFHALFMLLLMGLNGAFLTGDLFNLFVFFEVLLAASYGLVLHGSGGPRVKAGLHYIAINLSASALFLIGVSMIYGITGTLNMADLAVRIPAIEAGDLLLFEIGCALLGIAFLVKAGMWPLGFWLPATYSASSAPAAAMFAIMTKVGVYIVLRLSLLLFGEDAGASAGFGAQWVLAGGLATLVFGAIGVLASRTLSRIAGFCVLMSSGAVLAVIGAGGREALSGALYYMISSTLAVSAFFLLIELLNRARGATGAAVAAPVFSDEYRDPYDDGAPDEEVGVIIPAAIALISGAFLLCTLLLAAMPPLSGFIGKFAIMAGLLQGEGEVAAASWTLIGVLTFSSLTTLIALVRVGIEVLWAPSDNPPPRVRTVEFAAIAGLLLMCVLLTVQGGPALRYMDATTAWLHTPQDYIRAVLEPSAAPELAEAAP